MTGSGAPSGWKRDSAQITSLVMWLASGGKGSQRQNKTIVQTSQVYSFGIPPNPGYSLEFHSCLRGKCLGTNLYLCVCVCGGWGGGWSSRQQAARADRVSSCGLVAHNSTAEHSADPAEQYDAPRPDGPQLARPPQHQLPPPAPALTFFFSFLTASPPPGAFWLAGASRAHTHSPLASS